MRAKVDGKEEVLRHERTGHLGWHYYHVLRDGVPVREVSVPVRLEDQQAGFRIYTGGTDVEVLGR